MTWLTSLAKRIPRGVVGIAQRCSGADGRVKHFVPHDLSCAGNPYVLLPSCSLTL